ncbi:MAG: hypothetical protein KDJ36_01785 [Hyphomicrobiaceae bacterium]|nr:hypothetical protein [Hyphomicrobiaceae bacterium]
MTARSLRNIETRKKKARRNTSNQNASRNQGNTGSIRGSLKKAANLARGRAAAPAEG